MFRCSQVIVDAAHDAKENDPDAIIVEKTRKRKEEIRTMMALPG